MASSDIVHVIDDDEAMRESLAFLLKSAKVAVEVYPSAMAFLERLPTVKGGCIITDVRMPDLSGIDLLQRLRRQLHAGLLQIELQGLGYKVFFFIGEGHFVRKYRTGCCDYDGAG